MLRFSICLFVLWLTIVGLETVHAEHRVALLIANSNYDHEQLALPSPDLQAAKTQLEQQGFRCTSLTDLTGEELQTQLNAFIRSTPTRGTAAVYFEGQLLPGNHKGNDDLFLVGTDAEHDDLRSIGSRGYRLSLLMEELASKGGNSDNLIMLKPAKVPEAKQKKLTDEAQLIFHNGESVSRFPELRGNASLTVSPAEKFVEGKNAGDEWVNSRGMVFCWCPAGEYTAGSPPDVPARYPDEDQHQVTIERGFWISKYELTLRENLRGHPRQTIAEHKNEPLTMINHDDAKRMTQHTLTGEEQKQDRLPQDWEYALPTEEQWEYAARAGTTTRFYFGNDLEQLPQHANFGDRSYYQSKDIFSNAAHRTLDDGAVQLAIVGSYQPNPWGLYDMYGNVAEWCIDYAIRGGSWVSSAENCRSAYRDHFTSRNEQNFIGYRLVIQPKQ